MLRSLKSGKFNSLQSKILQNFIARPSRVSGLLSIPQPMLDEFTREKLKKRIERPFFEEEDRLKEEEENKRKAIEDIFNLPSNDRNPANHIKVRLTNSTLVPEIPFPSTQPFITYVEPKKENENTANGIRRKIPVLLKKMKFAASMAKKCHVVDFLSQIEGNPKKSFEYLSKALKQVLDHAIQKNLDVNRLYVKSIMTGKHRRIKRIRYHAKSRHGTMIRDSTQLNIVLEEMPLEEFFKNMLKGKFPHSFARDLRDKIVEDNMDYPFLQKYQAMLTAKGRQQQRLMFKRTVQIKFNEMREKGIQINKDYLEEQMLNTFVQDYCEKYTKHRIAQSQESLAQRRKVYEDNEKNA